jgi:hypothetical protein
MAFSHPLARAAKAFAGPHHDRTQRTLVVVTTLALDPTSKRYKKKLIAQLALAAQEYVVANPNEASGFILINRMRDWDTGLDAKRS